MLLRSSSSSTLAYVPPTTPINKEEPVINAASLRPLIVSFPSIKSCRSSFVDSGHHHQSHATFSVGDPEHSRSLHNQAAQQLWSSPSMSPCVGRAQSENDLKSLCVEASSSSSPTRVAASSLLSNDQKAHESSRGLECNPFSPFSLGAFDVGDRQDYAIVEEEKDKKEISIGSKLGDFSSYEEECSRRMSFDRINVDCGGLIDYGRQLYCVDEGQGDHGGGGKTNTSKCSGFGGGAPDANLTDLYCQKMVVENPGNPLLLRNYAQYLAEVKRDYGKAEEYYARAILASPRDGELLAQYAGIVWKIHRDHDRAASYFERATQAAPEDSHVVAAYAAFLWDTEEQKEEEDNDRDGDSRPLLSPL